jgi:hypothetical protein
MVTCSCCAGMCVVPTDAAVWSHHALCDPPQVGPEGCGKSTLLEYCFSRLMGVSVAVVNCSAQTSASNVIQKLMQVCKEAASSQHCLILILIHHRHRMHGCSQAAGLPCHPFSGMRQQLQVQLLYAVCYKHAALHHPYRCAGSQ